MKIAMIAAVANHNAIGVGNTLPWHLPEDLQHFKSLTTGKPIIMGRKTFESIGRPLPNRTNIVITRDPAWQHDGVSVTHHLGEAIALARAVANRDAVDEIMVIGGAQIYQQALSMADTIYLTRIDLDVEADAFFPQLDETQWQEIERENHASATQPALHFAYVRYRRN